MKFCKVAWAKSSRSRLFRNFLFNEWRILIFSSENSIQQFKSGGSESQALKPVKGNQARSRLS